MLQPNHFINGKFSYNLYSTYKNQTYTHPISFQISYSITDHNFLNPTCGTIFLLPTLLLWVSARTCTPSTIVSMLCLNFTEL